MENISNTLYSIIDEIGKAKIQSDITLKIELTRHYIQIIFDRFNRLVGNASDESIGSLCEALLHFMLTACTMPSARKVTIDNIDIDIVIPNIPTLSNSPDKAIVIQIPKDVRSLTKQIHENLTTFQPNIKNLWIVTKEPVLGNYLNYSVELENNRKTVSPWQLRSFYDIIVDIDTFLQQTKDRTFRFFH
jgi:hypothetical protein